MLILYVMGVTIFGPTQGKIGALSATMAETDRTPKLDQITKINRLQAYLMKTYRIDFILLVIALVAMARFL